MTQDLQHRILTQALPSITFDGWTMAVLRAAAKQACGDEREADRAFPGGVVEAILAYCRLADERMREHFESTKLHSMRVPDRIFELVKLHLEQNAKHREVIQRAVAVLSLPTNAQHALSSLYKTVDAIWYAAGDTSTDFSYYTRRLTLAGVYSSTLLYWLNDESPGQAETWEFLRRRLADVGKFGKFAARFKNKAA